MKTCASCGSVAESSAKRCPVCGAVNFRPSDSENRPETEKDQSTISRKSSPINEDSASVEIDFSDKRNEILLKMARPDIYRINAFRILEIPVTATTKEISNHVHKLDVLENLGDTSQIERGFLSLIPQPDTGARHEAEYRLGNPESRLIDELFWFWPLATGRTESTDDALAALIRNDFSGAVAIWKHREENASEANVSMHNLAIMYHVLALDIEYMQADNLTEKLSRQKQEYWKQAFSRWQILLEHEGFWGRMTQRIHELKDDRLTTGTIRRLRAGLPLVLLSINASLAIQAMERGNIDEASQQINFIKKSGFNKAVMDEALRRAAIPIRERINITCDAAENEVNNAPDTAIEVINDLISQTTELLETLDILLPKNHAIRESGHDKVASQILSIDITYTNETKKWNESLEILKRALQIAVGASMRKRIEDNIEINKTNIELGSCWFCKTNPPDEKSELEVKMFGDVQRTPTYQGTEVTWRHTTIKVPRCKKCKSASSTATFLGCSGLAVGVALAILAGVSTQNGWVGFIIFVVCAIVGFIIPPLTRPKGIKSEDYKKEFPAIKQLLAKGWNFGEKPSGVQ